jgi:hypothetical protein
VVEQLVRGHHTLGTIPLALLQLGVFIIHRPSCWKVTEEHSVEQLVCAALNIATKHNQIYSTPAADSRTPKTLANSILTIHKLRQI